MPHPLQCSTCHEYRVIEYEPVKFEDSERQKGFIVDIPFYCCLSCKRRGTILPRSRFMEQKEMLLRELRNGEYFDLPLKNFFSKLDSERRFEKFDHLEFQYDPRDYYIIPGLYRDWDDGYLTPVFFEKSLLLHYNNHPEYTVKFTSFSSCNIYHNGEPMFEWGMGVNRGGRLFKWLGDLERDFRDDKRKPDLRRFQASNIPSDHDVASKFYLGQNPFSEEDAFQESDNESKLFELINSFNSEMKERFGEEISKVKIGHLSGYYKSPIMEERGQVFSSFLSLNKYLIENLQEQSLKKILRQKGLTESEFQKGGKNLGSLKLFALFIRHALKKENADDIVAPLFVLNDLRQLHGHLSDSSFDSRYSSCKERLGLANSATDLEVFTTLVSNLVLFYQSFSV